MLLTLMFLAAQDAETAVDAERAFNRAAQTQGQWTAFRQFAAADAVVFTPQEARAHDVLPTKNPPIAVQWWPAESYVSCDGTAAINTGPWVRPTGFGYFTTAWQRQADGHFKWTYDGGDALATPRALPEQPLVRRASCRFQRSANPNFATMAAPAGPGHGKSEDGTLLWDWKVAPDGSRTFTAWLWNGRSLDRVVHDQIAAPK